MNNVANRSGDRMSNARNFSFALAAGLALLIAAPAHGQDASTLSLRQAVTLALQNSRDVKLAQVQYNVALGEARVNRAAFLPNVYTGSGAAYTHGFPSLPGGQAPAVFEMDYTQSVFDPCVESSAARGGRKSPKPEDRA